uniref:Hpc2-related domain-containing protein n=1 Tax=Stomoxys calcitrans TaxID=35570 RepID=A0A1I8NYY7_STOCA
MSDPKRVTLTTISSTVSSSLMTAGSSRFGADFLAPADKIAPSATVTKNGNKTLRLKVELFQTDCNKYPEFDYAKLLHVEKKKLKKLKQKSNGFSDPFEENDDDVARIAKELERKYGNAYVSGRGKNKRDEIDIGLGYDESDSFIDNTEAYDEMIPDEVETIEGGFYINCGALEFKKLHTESTTTKTDEIIKMPDRPRKRVISSSSSEESSSSDDEDEDDDDDSEDDDDDDEDSAEEASVETTKSKSSSSAAAAASTAAVVPIDKKTKATSNSSKKKTIVTPAENGNAAKKRKIKNVKSAVSTGSSSNSPKPPTDDLASDSERERNAKKIEKTTTVKDMLKAQRDNFLKSQTGNDPKSAISKQKGKSSAEEAESSEGSDDDDDDDDDDESDNNSDSNQSASKAKKDKKSASSNEENHGNEKIRSADTKLPEMEADVLASIIDFRDGLRSKNLTGKKIQFDEALSESLLKIDDSLLCIDKADRSSVYAHMEYQLSLPKYFFFRKARQLREREEKMKSKRAFNKLHKAVTETMPAVIASYDAELRRYAELQAANVNSDQPPKMPKKKFPWNPNLRNLLYDVYQVRWTSYPVLGKKKDTLEDFITIYMSKKVVEIWPKGWMRYEELQKEIEKRKTAAKKAKEKAAKLATASTAPASLNTASSTTQNPSQECNPRSNTNSDTESVASSSASSGLKRKNPEPGPSKTKPKAAKLNGEQQKSKNIPVGLDLTSPNKKTDHSINHIISPTSAATSTAAMATASSIFSSTVAALSQPLKHSNNTHVIDLDNYTCPNDIMQQAAAANAALASYALSNAASLNHTTAAAAAAPSSRRESSGDSEIEIVGFYPATKNANRKQKTNSRSGTPNSNPSGGEKTYNNNNNNRNSKKSLPPNSTVTSGALNLLGVEGYNKMVNAFMDLGEHLQVQPILKATAAQKSTQPPSSSSSAMPSNMPHQ